jgi:hypothetical protein
MCGILKTSDIEASVILQEVEWSMLVHVEVRHTCPLPCI